MVLKQAVSTTFKSGSSRERETYFKAEHLKLPDIGGRCSDKNVKESIILGLCCLFLVKVREGAKSQWDSDFFFLLMNEVSDEPSGGLDGSPQSHGAASLWTHLGEASSKW